MEPLDSPEGREHVERNVRRLALTVGSDIFEALRVEPEDQPPLLGLAWTHDEDTGWLDELRVLVDAPGAGDPDDPSSWTIETFHGVADQEDERAGKRLVASLRAVGVAAPAEAIAAAVAAAWTRRHWWEVHPAPGYRAWTKRDGTWRPIGEPEPPLVYPDLPHLTRWIDDDDVAARVRARVVKLADRVRAVVADEGEEVCGVGLFAAGEDTLDLCYLFILTSRERDAAADPAELLTDSGAWTESTPEPTDDDEGVALARVLADAGAFDAEALMQREVVDRLRAGDWPGARVADDLIVLQNDR